MRLSCGDDLLTLGPQLRIKKNIFQGLVMQLSDTSSIASLLARVKQVPRLRKFQHFPHALRVRRSSNSSSAGPEEVGLEELQRKKCYCVSEDPGVFEMWEDDDEGGVGDRLLHLLQRWQVENVVVLVARQDDSLCGRLIGAELFKLNVEAAKLALEQYYLENIKPSDAAKLELMETAPTSTPGGPYQPLSARQLENGDGSQQQQHQQTASVCLMTSETIPSWPVKHQSTSDGGGRKGVRQGRINHGGRLVPARDHHRHDVRAARRQRLRPRLLPARRRQEHCVLLKGARDLWAALCRVLRAAAAAGRGEQLVGDRLRGGLEHGVRQHQHGPALAHRVHVDHRHHRRAAALLDLLLRGG